MPRLAPLAALAFAWSLALPYVRADVQFISHPLPAVKDMAAQEGKMYFVHFTARWCMPCRWMEENTFTDPELAAYVQANYLAVRMDIDEPYGLKCKEDYDVKLLPTLLVFNARGELLSRREASMDAGPLLELLRRYRHAEPVVPVASASAVLPPPVASARPLEPGSLSRPPLLPDVQEQAEPVVWASPSKHMAPVADAEPAPREAGQPFTIQAGVFGDYQNAINEVNRLENLLRRPVLLTAFTPPNSKPTYRITIGSFSSRQTAESYLQYLRSKGVTGFVKLADVGI